MRIHRVSLFGTLLVGLALPSALVGQASVPDYLVRVTLRDSSAHRLVGYITLVTSDSLALQLFESDSIARIDRNPLLRIERRPDVGIGKAMLAGCVAVGGILALAGSQVHDPDSPGIETVAAVVGGLFGCLLGAVGGFAIGSLSQRNSWEEITLCDPIGSRSPLPNERCS
jgi:hypothetical protein